MKKPVPDKTTPPKKARHKKAEKKGGRFLLLLAIVIIAIAVLPLTVIVAGGMVPAFTALCLESSPAKNRTIAVGCLNSVGVIYLSILLFKKAFTVATALFLLSQPLNWIILWGGAAVGIGLFTLIPAIITQILVTFAELKIKKLQSQQQKLKQDWGSDVAEE